MQIIDSPSAMRQFSDAERRAGRRIGFVPTMGALHEGHLQLIRRARAESDVVVISIYVNPTQFAPHEDLTRYPRPFERDCALAAEEGVDVIFHPDDGAMYPAGSSVRIDPGALASSFEGAVRPGHFAGVATIVLKLFNIVAPDFAVFGQKDAQQAVLIRRLVADLNVPVALIMASTVREADGMAMSSRNVYLSQSERSAARSISASLFAARDRHAAGERNADLLRACVADGITAGGVLSLDYAAVVDAATFTELHGMIEAPSVLVIVAARAGTTRLIDNIALDNTGALA